MNELEPDTYVPPVSNVGLFHTVRSKVEVTDTRSSEVLGREKNKEENT